MQDRSMKQVMITGADGQLGKALLELVPDGYTTLPANRATLDITSDSAVRQWCNDNKPSAIINAAAYTAVDKAESDTELASLVNEQGAGNLARAAAEHDIPIVQVSTDFIFNGRKGSPYLPEDSADPLSIYGATKLGGEQLVLAEAASRATIIRTAWVYNESGSNFVTTMLRLMAERDSLSVVADQVGTPTNVNGLADACWNCLAKEVRGIHHWTDAGVASWYDFAHIIQQTALDLGLLNREIPVLPIPASQYPTPAVRPTMSVLDKTSTWAALQCEPIHWQVQLRTALEKLVR
ncbi:dTDP-4-dehydrorhamnose reductase [Chromatiales bacterium (ex Bugula neritina AB1)]|nr:dTDP-4-dehydrorhamnose reductase [Chromatiales bacterium (ex Bugula neritina AB1)]